MQAYYSAVNSEIPKLRPAEVGEWIEELELILLRTVGMKYFDDVVRKIVCNILLL